MVKRTTSKRLSTSSFSASASRSIDLKARRRIEELYELTDEIINAYNEINEKYVHQIYRKYQRLKEENKKLRDKLAKSRCANRKNQRTSTHTQASDASSDEEVSTKMSPERVATENSVITRSMKRNPFIISDIDETQQGNNNDTRFPRNVSMDDQGKNSNATATADHQNEADDDDGGAEGDEQKEEEEDEEPDDADDNYELSSEASNDPERLPLTLQLLIQRKAKKNRNAKAYLLEIPRYPLLCDFLRDKSRQSFYSRPTEEQVRPLIANHISPQLANDAKMRMRVRDELREIHRSYLRNFMVDPRTGQKARLQTASNQKLPTKKSPQ